ncbi:MAG: ATP-binding protein [Intestinibacillus sp.]
MEIVAIQGNFGNLSGKKFTFSGGLCHSVLPNGWGKSTLCAFLRVMLYGLNTAKRDTAAALSDKTHYLPQDGKPMYGRMTVRYGGREIVVTRSTGKGGPMQEFDAFYVDTGEKCAFLNAKNCGEQLLGMGEDAFLSSAFIDGAELQRPSEELRERMLSMAQAGDTRGRAVEALRTLDRWRLDLDSGNGHGELPRIAARLSALDGQAAQLQGLEAEIRAQEEQVAVLEQEAAAARAAYDKAYRDYAGEMASEEGRLSVLIAESERMVGQLDAQTPPETVIRRAAEALYGYQGAVRLEREKREALPQGVTRHEEALERLERERREDEIARNEAGRPRIRWWALLMALLFAIASAATILFHIEWGRFTAYAAPALSALAVISVVLAFAGSVPKPQPPARDFAAEREKLLRARAEDEAAQSTAASVLRDAFDELMAAARAIDPDARSIEQAEQAVLRAQENLQALRREESALQELLLRQKKLLPRDLSIGNAKQAADRARSAMEDARVRLEAGRQALSRLQGRAQASGGGALRAEQEALLRQKAGAEMRQAAVRSATDAVREEHALLSARVSPLIAQKTRDYLNNMTDGM